GRREIDDLPEWPHEDASFDKAALQFVHVADVIEFNDANRAFDPHAADMRKAPGRLKAASERRLYCRDLFEARFALEKIERSIGGGAGKRIGHEGRAVHQRAGWLA